MHRTMKFTYGSIAVFILVLMGLWACETGQDVSEVTPHVATCEGCHNDEAALRKLAPEGDDDGHGGGG